MGIKKRKSKKGFTVIEAIISLVLFTLIMIPLGSFTLTAVKTSVKSATKEQAINAGQGVLEQVKDIKGSELLNLDKTIMDYNKDYDEKCINQSSGLIVSKKKGEDYYRIQQNEYEVKDSKYNFNIEGTMSLVKTAFKINEDADKNWGSPDANYCIYISGDYIDSYKIVGNQWRKPESLSEESTNKNDVEKDEYNLSIIRRKNKITIEWLNKVVTFNVGEDESPKIKILFSGDERNKKINLKIDNFDTKNSLDVYACKYVGSGIYYELKKSDSNSNGIVNIYINYSTQNRYTYKDGLYNIEINVKYKDEVIYKINTTEFIEG
ncbi:prepilin-type N-terminal cleavage/methylation domain-containing protein [Clostridium perfringens]|nr:prepilin-type N-terminal cleavage/methylation domain-containing protein [Clostridium perfringens]MDK0793826.1 prepilin-type N-terminal cleavage/methylation domain-containing protein [Clostridium perfringens]